MELILVPISLLVANLFAAFVLAILKDVGNNLVRGETQLVLQKLSINRKPARSDTPHVEISGRRAGLIGYILTLFDLSPKVQLTGNAKEVRKSTLSLHGQSIEVIPLSDKVSLSAESQRSLFWLAAAIFSLTFGVASGLIIDQGGGFIQQVLNALAWVAAAVFYIFCFYQSHTFQIAVQGSMRVAVSFQPNVIEGRMIQFQEVMEAAEVLLDRIQESRTLGGASAGTGSFAVPHVPATVPLNVPSHFPPPVPAATQPVPTPFAPAARQPVVHHAEEPVPQTASAATPQPVHSGTGTVEYGDEQTAFEASPTSGWSGGPEPGTSDSIQLRQSITRSETGMFLGVSGNYNDVDYDDLDSDEGDIPAHPHRGTVSWEEHADKTQDEMRAEAELAELKQSRPKRGEAKLRLRELMRRFPQTEAAAKARRMLERLEAGQ